MEVYKEVSAKLVNKPGRLAAICAALAKEKINIIALSVMDSGNQSTLRFVASDPKQTIKVLQSLSTPHEVVDVLVVELQNRPGALAKVCERLGTEHVNIEYAYCSSGRPSGKTIGIFRVSNLAKARRVLTESETEHDRRPAQRRPVYAR